MTPLIPMTRLKSHPAVHREMIGRSAVMHRLREQAWQAARSGADILVEGESGSGKEMLARLIHRLSPQAEGPFVMVNCAALSETCLDFEWLSHARGGMLLLDEVSEMPLVLQPKLLRAWEEREALDARVIAASSQPLAPLVADGRFRSDLYYRLNVIPLRIPPLRERREDIPDLVQQFLIRHSPRAVPPLESVEEATPQLPGGFLASLGNHAWPGNIRELENLVRRVLALGLETCTVPAAAEGRPQPIQAGRSMRDVQKQMLEMTLQATKGNRTHAAAMLGVSLRTVRNKIREFGLSKPPAASPVGENWSLGGMA
jgi:DNA-binding NtrC family response regulator